MVHACILWQPGHDHYLKLNINISLMRSMHRVDKSKGITKWPGGALYNVVALLLVLLLPAAAHAPAYRHHGHELCTGMCSTS